ncbi:MAG TPA: pyridoxamine 5'-phosphate oxidase family protein [Bryobacteraceae bacterium]|jgi:pyridoxine/pyridoxamine 5'-phosphate oxidase|nr:pyridoxamine 5'-phosphate oxidase family protein [Bryobacteraceae bacterium]
MRRPKAARPVMPGYGIRKGPKGLLTWTHVEERMSGSRNYWVATTRPDGRPHVMPVWGVWVEGRFYFSTDRGSRKGRNLAQQPAITVHLESGDDAVILEGAASLVTDATLLSAIDDAYNGKYGIRVVGHPGDSGIYAVTLQKVFAWREKDFPVSATRWQFTPEEPGPGRQ